jgi:hypothetical protein
MPKQVNLTEVIDLASQLLDLIDDLRPKLKEFQRALSTTVVRERVPESPSASARPGWKRAYALHQRARKKLPPESTLREIYGELKSQSEHHPDDPDLRRLPRSLASFAQQVRAHARATGVSGHRVQRRKAQSKAANRNTNETGS